MAEPVPHRLHMLLAQLARLKGPIAAVATVGAILGGLAGYWNAYHAAREAVVEPAPVGKTSAFNLPAEAGPLSIIVLPLANQTGDPAKAYIADALTSSLSSDLNRIRDAFVVPTASAFAYKDKNLSVAQVGQDAGVRFVLQGGVIASGDKLRINLQLAYSRSGKQLWNDTFEGETTDLFALHDTVTARIANSLGDQMVLTAARESEKRKSSPKVADLMIRYRALRLKPLTLDSLKDTEALLRAVVKQEPDHAVALASLAHVLARQAMNSSEPDQPSFKPTLAEAKATALRAKALNAEIPEIYWALGIYAGAIDLDMAEARRNFEIALRLEPKSPVAYQTLAVHYRAEGQAEQSIELLRRALTLYPKGSDALFANLAWSYLMLGDNQAAVDWGHRALDAGGSFPRIFSCLAMGYGNLGQQDKALQFAEEHKRRMAALGRKPGPDRLDGNESAAFLKYYDERYLPEWRKAGLPE